MLVLAALAFAPAPGAAQTTGTIVALPAPPAAASGASGSIDVAAATRAYLDLLTPEQKAKSDAYFEGGYWLILWGFLWTSAIYLLLLQTGMSARMRDGVERTTSFKPLQTILYWAMFVVVLDVLSLPFDIYQDYFREHQYGMSNLTAAGWYRRAAQGLPPGSLPGCRRSDHAVRHRAAHSAHVVGVGKHRVGRGRGLPRRDLPSGDLADIQQPHAPRRRARRRAHSHARARERDRCEGSVAGRRIQADQAHERERERTARYRADHAERQFARARFVARDRSR